jgi:hypothetical protein
MKNARIKFLLISTLSMIILIVIWRISPWQTHQAVSLISVSTDRQEYRVDDTLHISIQNLGDHAIDIFCPAWCALGNFPSSVEKFSNGQWQYFAGFCPSIEPLFGSGVVKGDYIRHSLSAKSSFELELSNLESLRLQKDEQLRIVYYLDEGRVPLYSNVFFVIP